jgi:hypothetical protein
MIDKMKIRCERGWVCVASYYRCFLEREPGGEREKEKELNFE